MKPAATVFITLFFALILASCHKNDGLLNSAGMIANGGTKLALTADAATTAYKDSNITRFFNRTAGWIASDAGYTIPLKNGKILWLMGDTYLDNFDPKTGTMPCLFQVRNSGLLQPAVNNWNWQQTSTLTGSRPGLKSYLKNKDDDNSWLWPMCGFQQGDTVYEYCSNFVKTGNGAFDFANVQPDVMAKISPKTLAVYGYDTLPDFNGITFGTKFITENDGYMYTYGFRKNWIICDVFIARFPVGKPSMKWTFWNGTQWVANVKEAKVITQGASTSVDFCKVGKKYIMVTSEFSVGCDQGKQIYASKSNSLTGPFTKYKPIYTITDTIQGHYPFFYSVITHPEFTKNNELLITYCINGYGDCLPFCVNFRANPDYYRPRGVRIPLTVFN